MNAVILEKLNHEFIVLTEDETMLTIPALAGFEVGDVVELCGWLQRQPLF